MTWLLLALLIVQGAAMAVDEGWFHHRRGLPRWERVGHPIDTLTIVLCLGWLVLRPATTRDAAVYVGLAVMSCVVVTKDEWVHAKLCAAGEHWVHAILFMLHPLVLAAAGLVWWSGRHPGFLAAQLGIAAVFGLYQTLHWNVTWRAR